MLKFEYEIRLNDQNRPYIHLPDNFVDIPEHKFMVFELTRYIIGNIFAMRGDMIPEKEKIALEKTNENLAIMSDELAVILKKRMEVLGQQIIDSEDDYHVTVNNFDERNKLNYEGFVHKGRIFKRVIGLKVLVIQDMNVYELVDGIDNENWKKV